MPQPDDARPPSARMRGSVSPRILQTAAAEASSPPPSPWQLAGGGRGCRSGCTATRHDSAAIGLAEEGSQGVFVIHSTACITLRNAGGRERFELSDAVSSC